MDGSRRLGGVHPHGEGRGLVRIATLADRVRRLDAIDWSRVEVIHGDVRDVEPIRGSRVFIDPPYQGCPRYAALLPRLDVLALATRWGAVAEQVVVSEAEPLPLPGWLGRDEAGIVEARDHAAEGGLVTRRKRRPLPGPHRGRASLVVRPTRRGIVALEQAASAGTTSWSRSLGGRVPGRQPR